MRDYNIVLCENYTWDNWGTFELLGHKCQIHQAIFIASTTGVFFLPSIDILLYHAHTPIFTWSTSDKFHSLTAPLIFSCIISTLWIQSWFGVRLSYIYRTYLSLPGDVKNVIHHCLTMFDCLYRFLPILIVWLLGYVEYHPYWDKSSRKSEFDRTS